MPNDEDIYRGCTIHKVPDHRGRTQWWVTIPREQGTLRHMCNSLDDGKRVIDEHLDRDTNDPKDYTAVVALVLLLAALAAAFFAT